VKNARRAELSRSFRFFFCAMIVVPCAFFSFANFFAARVCISDGYFSRRMTSPWPTSWSFNHKRYLYVAALLPGRGGPLSRRIPAGA